MTVCDEFNDGTMHVRVSSASAEFVQIYDSETQVQDSSSKKFTYTVTIKTDATTHASLIGQVATLSY